MANWWIIGQFRSKKVKFHISDLRQAQALNQRSSNFFAKINFNACIDYINGANTTKAILFTIFYRNCYNKGLITIRTHIKIPLRNPCKLVIIVGSMGTISIIKSHKRRISWHGAVMYFVILSKISTAIMAYYYYQFLSCFRILNDIFILS